jgi:hypothetical protein
MKLYGYAIGDSTLHKMQEVTIQADAKRIRSIAEFLSKTADLMEKHGDKFSHEHYCDNVSDAPEDLDLGVDLIIAK